MKTQIGFDIIGDVFPCTDLRKDSNMRYAILVHIKFEHEKELVKIQKEYKDRLKLYNGKIIR